MRSSQPFPKAHLFHHLSLRYRPFLLELCNRRCTSYSGQHPAAPTFFYLYYRALPHTSESRPFPIHNRLLSLSQKLAHETDYTRAMSHSLIVPHYPYLFSTNDSNPTNHQTQHLRTIRLDRPCISP